MTWRTLLGRAAILAALLVFLVFVLAAGTGRFGPGPVVGQP